MAGVLLLHFVAFSTFVFFQEEKWLSFQKRETEHRGGGLGLGGELGPSGLGFSLQVFTALGH